MKISPTVRASLELLGVEPGTNQADLKKAYHRLAMVYHPDRSADSRAVGEFRRVTEAYELLTDQLRVDELNRKYLRERLHRPVIEGLQITFGTFFGYRIFNPQVGKNAETVARLTGQTRNKDAFDEEDEFERWGPIEENNSILDHAAFDAIEVAYAGKMSTGDEEALKGQIGGTELARLPWVVLNNQGLLRFLDGDLRGAKKRYAELCERVPNNIIFMYRLRLCWILEGFQQPKRTLLGLMKPDRIKIEKGLKLLENCLKLGTSRPVGRQKCLVIRKTIADVLEKLGRDRAARKVWKEILHEDPRCAEAVVKVKGFAEARRLLRSKQSNEAAQMALRQLNAGQSSKNSTSGSK